MWLRAKNREDLKHTEYKFKNIWDSQDILRAMGKRKSVSKLMALCKSLAEPGL